MKQALLALLLSSLPALAQTADVEKLASGGVNYALAWGLAVAITGGGWLGHGGCRVPRWQAEPQVR